MNSNTVGAIFSVGKCFLLSPKSPSEKKPSLLKHIFAFILIILYTIAALAHLLYNLPDYRSLSLMQMTFLVMTDVALYCSAIYFPLMTNKITLGWYHLIRNLSQVCGTGANRSYSFAGFFTVSYFVTVSLYVILGRKEGVSFFYYFPYRILAANSMNFGMVTGVTVLQMLHQCYHVQKNIVQRRILTKVKSEEIYSLLEPFERGLFTLSDAVSHFNDIFGWNILFSHIIGVCRTLIYIDELVRTQTNFQFSLETGAILGSLLIFWNLDDILDVLLKIKFNLMKMGKLQEAFLDEIEQIRPTFSAARFYSISRPTIFSLSNPATTFLIVLLQFHIN
uniref:Gustatory receptor n=1 Tax=Tribolium castaneum TaxID=7070 RepID=B8PUL7_TRICA|nr:gustatory receptor [Tribolium castaneum]